MTSPEGASNDDGNTASNNLERGQSFDNRSIPDTRLQRGHSIDARSVQSFDDVTIQSCDGRSIQTNDFRSVRSGSVSSASTYRRHDRYVRSRSRDDFSVHSDRHHHFPFRSSKKSTDQKGRGYPMKVTGSNYGQRRRGDGDRHSNSTSRSVSVDSRYRYHFKSPSRGRDDNYHGGSSRGREQTIASWKRRRDRADSSASHMNDWRCVECNLWNFQDMTQCERCGTSNSRRSHNNNRGDDVRGDNRDGDSTSIGKSSASRNSQANGLEHQRQMNDANACEWPPCFDTEGAAFTFDSRSGMFYEARSSFFYDPKSKLYYGNKKMTYFRYDKTKDPPFVEVQQMSSASAGGEKAADSAITDTSKSNKSNKDSSVKTNPLISIKLKTKKIKPSKAGTLKSVAISSKVQKQQVANIEKWSVKRTEINEKASISPSNATESAAEYKKVSKTVKGEPICRVCKRKFSNVEKLTRHEKVSELHKKNLAKLAAITEKRKEAPSVEYQDRAKKRRELHGEGVVTSLPLKKDSVSMVDEQKLIQAPPPKNLDSGNIGNKMLKKLGWKEGTILGRNDNDELAASSDSQPPTSGRQELQHESIRKDWDRIEALAANPVPIIGGPQRPGNHVPIIGVTHATNNPGTLIAARPVSQFVSIRNYKDGIEAGNPEPSKEET